MNDVRNTLIEVGDTIAVGVSKYQSSALIVGEVTKVTDQSVQISITAESWNYGVTGDRTGKRLSYKDGRRMVILTKGKTKDSPPNLS